MMTVMLLFSCLLGSFVGCEKPQDQKLSDKQKLIAQLKQDSNVDSGTIEFTADPFIQHGALSWMYSIDVKVIDGNIYLNDILYDKVEIINQPYITYSEGLLSDAYMADDEKISEALGKIQNSESCYILETEKNDATSKKMLVYNIDGIYYFLSFFEDEVMRIHYSNIKQEVET